MANQLLIPYMNPVQFFELNLVQQPQYESKHMDDHPFVDQILDFQMRVQYKRKWTIHDAIPLQFISDFDPIVIEVFSCSGDLIGAGQAMTQKRSNPKMPGYFIYESVTSLQTYDEGTYYMILTLAGSKKMFSEPFEVHNSLPDSLLIEYSNSTFHGDVIFETGIVFSKRFEGILLKEDPGNSRTSYIDQRLNPSTLNSRPFRVWNLVIGNVEGVPPSEADLLNWIFSCDNVWIDGKSYAVFDSEIEGMDIDSEYPMKPYSLKVREGLNRASKFIDVAVDANKRLLITVLVDSTIHHDLSEQAGSDLIIIENVE